MTSQIHTLFESTPTHGPSVTIHSLEIADDFEDYLDDDVYVLYNLKREGDSVTFYFGLASTESKVRELFERFVSSRNHFGTIVAPPSAE